MSALSADSPIVFELLDDVGFTDAEAYALLAGLDTTTFEAKLPVVASALIAAAETHTGAMIALVPSDADLERLTLEGGEPAEELHLTLMYLGDAANVPPVAREAIAAAVRNYAEAPITAQAFSVNVFNPAAIDTDTAVVLGVGNDGGPALERLHSNVTSAVRGLGGFQLPEQHVPWVPHVTLAYTDDLSVVQEYAKLTGPITFDKIRVAFGGENVDVPLEVPVKTNGEQAAEPLTASGDPMRVLANDRGLRNYWTRGAGAAKIRWGTDGSFDRCVRQLGRHVKNPQGLCAEYHKEATGEWPAEKGIQSAMKPLVAHGTHNQEDHGNWVDPDYSDAFDAPTRAGNIKRLRALEEQLEGDEGLNERESRELDQLRRIINDDNFGDDDDGDDGDNVAIDVDDDVDDAFEKEIKRRQEQLRKSKSKNGKYALENFATQQTADEPWDGILSVEGVESGDGRLFSLGSLDWVGLPAPLMYQPANVGGHNASIHVGDITQIARKGNEIYGWGTIFGNVLGGEHGSPIRALMKSGGVSVDVDKVKDADVELVYADGDEGGGFMAKPEMTIFNRGRIRGATLVAFPAFVEAKLHFTNEVVTASAADDCGCKDEIIVAAGHTITIPDVPPAHWFQEPTDVKQYGALTITDEGRVYAILGPAHVTHRSVRKTIPMGSKVDYSRWMNKETIVAGGARVKTGVITMNCGHAATENYGTLNNRKEHYDNSCSIFANVVVGETPGKLVWMAGALRHGVTAEQVATAQGCQLSGDWQPHPDRPGVQEFIAALLVPVPGFPMARTRPSVEYDDGVITASFVPVRFAQDDALDTAFIEARDAIAAAKSIIIASLGEDPKSRKNRVMAELSRES